MQTLTFDCEISHSRDLVLRLPDTVAPGRHRIAVVIDPEATEDEAVITPVGDHTPPRTALWAQLEVLRAQAQQEGTLPPPLTCDEILAEVERRRGESGD